jgi:hypothetical protein
MVEEMNHRANVRSRAHYGGHLGLLALLSVLVAAGCVTVMEERGVQSNWIPGWANLAKQQGAVFPAQAKTIENVDTVATFIVRFDSEPVLDEVGKSFRRDEAGARAVFADWQAKHPEVQGLILQRASYSGELILGLRRDDTQGRSAKDVLKALQAMDNNAYAELDGTATIGKSQE